MQQNQHNFSPETAPDAEVFHTLEDILGAAVSREDALSLIQRDADAFRLFSTFPQEEQENLLAFIQGTQGLSITYDSFFKHVMNPDLHPDRLEHFLSAILGQKVKIRSILPLEGVRMADAGSFVIMDIVVELSNGAFTDVEIQKIGYLFPGERSSCYVSDFIMRQYNRVKSERQKQFSFRDLRPVFLIVIMEKSSPEFTDVSPHYIHREQLSYDSGARVNSLSKIIYISLDTFHAVVQNISTELDAWLTFLSSDRPSDIIRLVSAYPEFLSCYRDIIEFRKNPKELIYMYSEALAILDRNTALYMCEEQQKMIEEQANTIDEMSTALSQKDAALSQKDVLIADLQKQLEELRKNS